MSNRRSRFLLLASAAVLALGALVHAASFNKASAAVQSANIPAFYANVLRAFWLMDSATLLLLAAVFALVAFRPTVASRGVIVILSLMPASTAALLYIFMGIFLPAHVLLAAAVLAVVSQLPSMASA
jgi:hypothetical protein